MSSTSRSYRFLWLALALFPLLAIAALLPLQPHDYWWYLRLGRDTLATGSVPLLDTYGARGGQPLVYPAWLSAALLWLTYQSGGLPLTALLNTLLVGVTYGLVWILSRRMGASLSFASALTLLSGLAGANNWTTRPQLFAYPLFMLALWILLDWNEKREKWLWSLALISLAWSNLHGSFVLLFAQMGLALLFGGGNKKKLLVALILAASASLLNPRRWALWQVTLQAFQSPVTNQFVTEWAATTNRGWQMNLFFAWMLLLAPLASFSKRRAPLFLWAAALLFLWLAFSGIRFVIWALFLLPALTASLLPSQVERKLNPALRGINYAVAALLLALPALLLPGARNAWMPSAPPALASPTPVEAAKWLAAHPELPGGMWNEFAFGSYFIYALPERPVWFDPRFQIAYNSQQVYEYLMVQSAKEGWQEYLKANDINLLALANYQTQLLQAARASAEWQQVYQDSEATLFIRRK